MRQLQILIVDDHEVSRRGIRSLLDSSTNWIVSEAVDGLDAIEKAKALRPDIVLMDISMPRMNGLEATRVISREVPTSKVVIVSQNDPSVTRRQAKEVSAVAYVPKSDLPEMLLPTLHKLMDENGAARPTNGEASRPAAASGQWLAGGGQLGKLIREHDWSKTPLGAIDNWPQSLRISVNLMLNSRHPMWIGWGPEMTFLYNDAYISVLSLAKHPECLGHPACEVWAEIWDICGPLANKVFEKGEATFVDDVHLFMSRGEFLEETYYSFSYSPIHDENGNIGGLFCPSTETTPKVLNARRLRTLSELSAKALIEKSTDATCASFFATIAKNPDDVPFALLYLLDADGRHALMAQSTGISEGIERVSPSQIDLQGESAESHFWRINEVFGSGRSEIVSLQSLDSVPTGPAGQRVAQAIVLPVTSRGLVRPIGILMAGVNPTRPLDSEYRTFYELMAGQVATAILNARAAEEERNRVQALAEIDRAKTAFFNNVSHEFRTPLTLMLGPVEDLLAKSHTDLSPAAKNQLELVNRNGSRLLRLVNTLLDFSRIEAGRMRVVYQPTDLSAFTIELASVFRSATEKAGLRLALDCPILSEPVYVDRDMWEKIVLNLISNAFKFTFAGEIGVSLLQAGNNVELRVRDTGVGIPAKELPHLFDRFHRVEDTRSRTHEGSGIGLALVQELAKLHGGSVRVESALGQGSTFIVTIPLGKAHLPADRIGGARSLVSTAVGAAPFVEEALGWLPDTESAASSEELPLDYEPMTEPRAPSHQLYPGLTELSRVLVADDNADMRQYLVRMLADRYDVQSVANGKLALEAVRERPPDLILTDVMMPELDGFGLLRELRSDPKTSSIPVIVLSARAGEEARVEGIEHGADDYLIKPFSSRELLARVQTHLELARVRKQSEDGLRQRTEQFETLLNVAPLCVYLVDANFRILQINPPARRSFGDIPDLIGRDFNEVIHILWPKQYADEIAERFRHTLESGESHVVPERMEIRSDRGVREIHEWQIHRIPLPDGTHGVVCYFRDISAQVVAREVLRESEDRLRYLAAIVDCSSDAIISKNLDGVITSWNKTAEHMYGYTAEEAIGKNITLILPPRRLAEEKMILERLRRDERVEHFETTRVRKDGTEIEVSLTISPVKDAHGRIVGASKVARDITERKQAERALVDSEKRLRALADSLEEKVRNRTAELRRQNREIFDQSRQLRELSQHLIQIQDNERRHIARELHDSAGQVLTALGMNLAAIADYAKDGSPKLAEAAEEGQALVRELSQEIRTMSYLLHPPLLDECGLSEALPWYIQGLKERSGLEITLAMPENFGRISRDMELVIFRIIQECLTNIHRHSGSKVATIRLDRNDKYISLDVEDEGKGISPEKLAEIQVQGTGVGIRGMRERVLQFGGQLKIESEGRGAKISIILPSGDGIDTTAVKNIERAEAAKFDLE